MPGCTCRPGRQKQWQTQLQELYSLFLTKGRAQSRLLTKGRAHSCHCPEPVCPVVVQAGTSSRNNGRCSFKSCTKFLTEGRAQSCHCRRTNMPCCTCRPGRQKQWRVQRLRCSATRDPWAARICTWRTSLSLTADKSSLRFVVPTIHTCMCVSCLHLLACEATCWFRRGAVMFSCIRRTFPCLWQSGDDSKAVQQQNFTSNLP